MISIYKYPLDFRVEQIIDAPIVRPLRIDFQNGVPHLWAIVDTEKSIEEWLVIRSGTGWNLSELPIGDYDSYLNSTVESSAPYVWHWFCHPLLEHYDSIGEVFR